MSEHSGLDDLREQVLAGSLSRRSVLKRGIALGLSAPVIAALLAACGGDDDDDDATSTEDDGSGQEATEVATEAEGDATEMATEAEGDATEMATEAEGDATEEMSEGGMGRGAGDQIRILYWQAPTILNPHFAQGDKDSSAAAPVIEPLLQTDKDGVLIPALAAEVPSLENGGVAADGMSVTYTLKEGVVWSDGEPFTAEDVRFTWEYIVDPDSSTTSIATYLPIEDVEVVDDLTVTIHFTDPTPGWFAPFVTGYGGGVLPKHLLENDIGATARDSEFNLNPVGTGPYIVTDFKPGDVVTYAINESYREPDKPYFSSVEFKGGGDAVSAARAAILTGEVDYAWNLQVESAVLTDMESQAETGHVIILPPVNVERILINFSDPNTEVDGQFSHLGTPHPFLSELEVRQALTYLCDRDTIANELYGKAGEPTSNVLVAPTRFVSPNTSYEFNPDKAAEMLDAAGWVEDGGQRQKDGVLMEMLYQTSTNSVRQKTQEIIKQASESIGIPIEIKAIDAGVFFSSDAGNPDTWAHFYSDIQMFTNGPSSTYPIAYCSNYKSDDIPLDIAQKENDWSGSNAYRWVNDDYNALYLQALTEMDPDAQVPLFIGMNDMIVNEVVEIPLVQRPAVSAINDKLMGNDGSPWTPETFDIANWYFEEE